MSRSDIEILLAHPKGSTVRILLYGATIVSWHAGSQRDPQPQERLFVSSTSSTTHLDEPGPAAHPKKPVRGGIPVVFPCFGPATHPEHSGLPQHGFARRSVWSWDNVIKDKEVSPSVTLTLEPTQIDASYKYTHPFHLSFIVTLGEFDLSTELRVKNTSTSTAFPPNDSFDFQALFHNYILAPIKGVQITPLQNKKYYDKTQPTEEGRATAMTETRASVKIGKFTDSVYEGASDSIENENNYQVTWSDDPNVGVAIKTTLKDVVVWNPQGVKMDDMEEGGWQKFVCCEPGHVRGFVKVEPGKTWVGKQNLSVIDNARRQ